MPRLSLEVKKQIKELSKDKLEQIVLKVAAKEQSVYDFVMVNYIDKEYGNNLLFEKTKNDLDILFGKRYKGFSQELQLANMLTACIRRINEFTKISKNKVMEANLLLYVLEVPFSLSLDLLGTCFTQYDSKVASILKRLITIVTKKIHEDYKVEFEDEINRYLQILHTNSNHLDAVYDLPKTIDDC